MDITSTRNVHRSPAPENSQVTTCHLPLKSPRLFIYAPHPPGFPVQDLRGGVLEETAAWHSLFVTWGKRKIEMRNMSTCEGELLGVLFGWLVVVIHPWHGACEEGKTDMRKWHAWLRGF